MPSSAIGSSAQPAATVAGACPDLFARYRKVREASLALTAPLSPEDLMVQSCAEASPAKWHLAHTSWFFETFVLREYLAGYKDFHPDFHWLFNSYYNSLGDMPAKSLRASFSRPPLADIIAYREYVDAGIARLLEDTSGLADYADMARRIRLGLEHEQQHQELIAADIKHAFFTNPLHPVYRESVAALEDGSIALPLAWVNFSPGLAEIGLSPSANAIDEFCFDNETPRHPVFIAPFSLATRLVTCAEYLAFIDDNGYTRPELWLSEGWTTIREENWQAPLYWQRDPGASSGWRIFTLRGWESLDQLSDTPVCHLSFFEADAYARWVERRIPGARLPTEFEWEFAASHPGMSRDGAAAANLLEAGQLHPMRASSLPGVQQIFGDVWEWTSSAYTGYPGYRPLPGALGEYNGKFMSSQIILRGGSCVTPASHIRATYRNFFAPGTRWQFSGLRLARDAS